MPTITLQSTENLCQYKNSYTQKTQVQYKNSYTNDIQTRSYNQTKLSTKQIQMTRLK